MSESLNIHLTTDLRHYVDVCASDVGAYDTPSSFIGHLIRKDRADKIVSDIMQGLCELRDGKAKRMTAMDIFNED